MYFFIFFNYWVLWFSFLFVFFLSIMFCCVDILYWGKLIFGMDVSLIFLMIGLMVVYVYVFYIYVVSKLMDDFISNWEILIMVLMVVFVLYVSCVVIILKNFMFVFYCLMV